MPQKACMLQSGRLGAREVVTVDNVSERIEAGFGRGEVEARNGNGGERDLGKILRAKVEEMRGKWGDY